ncbi:MAG TPA: hypothetical protein VF067_06310, partial [Sphingomicrobium sp.]
ALRFASGAVTSTRKAVLWTAVGMALVWLLQLLLNFLPNRIGPDQTAGLQLVVYDFAHSLKSIFTPAVFLALIVALLALSNVVGSLWPVNVAGQIKKYAGIAASVLIAFSSMTFVTVQAGSERFDASVHDIRASIGADLDRLRLARQDKAALQWLGATAEQLKESPEDVRTWQTYLSSAAEACHSHEAIFEQGFVSEPGHPDRIISPYCQPIPYSVHLAARQVEAPVTAEPQPKAFWGWVPEWAALRGSDQSMFPDIGGPPRRFADVQVLAKRVRTAANDEEKARDQVEASVVAVMTSLFPGSQPDAVAELVKSLKQAVAEAIYRDSRDRIAMWLRLRRLVVPRPIGMVLGIEPEVRLVSPAAEIQRAGGVDALVQSVWQREHPEGLEKVRETGQDQARYASGIYEIPVGGGVGPGEKDIERKKIKEIKPERPRPAMK